MSNLKEEVIEMIRRLPDDVELDDIIEAIYNLAEPKGWLNSTSDLNPDHYNH